MRLTSTNLYQQVYFHKLTATNLYFPVCTSNIQVQTELEGLQPLWKSWEEIDVEASSNVTFGFSKRVDCIHMFSKKLVTLSQGDYVWQAAVGSETFNGL